MRPDGKHEVATVLQRLSLADRLSLVPAPRTVISGFEEDTLVRDALAALAVAARHAAGWSVRIDKAIPVAAGLGGGSSDAATALRLANETLPAPVSPRELNAIARGLGADVPFFLQRGPSLGLGDGSALSPLDLPRGYVVVLVLPHGVVKPSTAAVYRRFDERGGASGYEQRRRSLESALGGLATPLDLARLPRNDLASSSLADDLLARGAFRADVTGAGPAVYGLFLDEAGASAAVAALPDVGAVWITRPE
jgi:4-diphosphocytidyl-2-C-methyl-D-erythritol kinase